MPFRKRVTANRTVASRLAMQFSDAYAEFLRGNPGAEVKLAFPFPPRGAMGIAPQIPKVARGMLLAEDELDQAQITMLQRGVVQAVCFLAGAPGDGAKAKEMLAAQAKVPAAVFHAGVAEMLYAGSQLFGEIQGNQPQVQHHFLRQASEALALRPSDKTKELKGKIEADQKKLAKRWRPS
jgi:hypothetical protein